MSNRSKVLLQSLREYYKNEDHLKCLTNIVNTSNNDTKKVSLRLVDWLVTNFSKSKNIMYYVDNQPFNMHQSYKDMLKAYSKKMFDPFRRHVRTYLECPLYPNGILETTVAQLTFFKWSIDNKVIEYAYKHRNEIKTHMDIHTIHRFNKNNNDDNIQHRIKRKELSKASKGANRYNVDIKVTFS